MNTTDNSDNNQNTHSAQRIFMTGISTEIGKTFSSAVVCKALDADYFKPLQAGELEFTDADTVAQYQGPNHTNHGVGIGLLEPMSPHAAADLENRVVHVSDIPFPKTDNTLVVEGAGGILVPINKTETIADMIRPEDAVILVSKHYLGSINHTLLSYDYLAQRGNKVGILFNGAEHPSTESIIASKTGATILGRLDWAEEVDADFVSAQAQKIQTALKDFVYGK
ncbi:MAG: dethiobiotin synthase [Schleiferiaceae bacterium]